MWVTASRRRRRRRSSSSPARDRRRQLLQHVPGRVVEVERPGAVVPFDLLEDRPCLVGHALLPALVIVSPSDEAGVNRASGAVGRGSRLGRRKVRVEEEQQAFAHAKRQTAPPDSPETEHLAVEPGQLLFLARRVVENRLKNALEPHVSTVLRSGLYDRCSLCQMKTSRSTLSGEVEERSRRRRRRQPPRGA